MELDPKKIERAAGKVILEQEEEIIQLRKELEEATNRIKKLYNAIGDLLEDIDTCHQPEWYSEESRLNGDNPLYCRTCGAQDGSWPCVHRMALNDLKEARRG